jgi:hypothetical protein
LAFRGRRPTSAPGRTGGDAVPIMTTVTCKDGVVIDVREVTMMKRDHPVGTL